MVVEAEDWSRRLFWWRDGQRLVRFGRDTREEILGLLSSEDLEPFVLLTTPRHMDSIPELRAAARRTVSVSEGPVPEVAGEVEREIFGDRSDAVTLVALGGGRVIDVAKALAAAHGSRCAAVPTTLSGAEMTPFHRPLLDGRGSTRHAPRLVVTDPELLTQPLPGLAASAMNAFGHAMEALYMPNANPVTSMAALEAARLLVEGLEAAEGERDALALGGLLAGYAIGSTGLGFHHALCQTVVRETGAPHAQVYAALGPRALRFMLPRAQRELASLVALLDTRPRGPAVQAEAEGPSAGSAVARLAALAGRSGVTGLAQLGVSRAQVPALAEAALARREVRRLDPPPSPSELASLLEEALQPLAATT